MIATDPPAVAAPPARPRFAAVRRHGAGITGGAILAVVIGMALFAPLIATIDPQALAPLARLRPPSAEHWFGTDMLGRDIWSRTVHGARVSLIVGLGVTLLACVAGVAIGLLAGYMRRLDGILMRIMDGLMSIPSILIAISLMALTQASVRNVILAIAIAEIPRVTRLIRGVVLTLREQPYVEAAIAVGTTTPRILVRHILPNVLPPLLVQGTYIGAGAMVTEAVLSFLGAGSPTSIPSWGNIMAEGRSFFQIAWWIILFPGAFLSLTVLAMNLLGDGLRDALDPRLSREM